MSLRLYGGKTAPRLLQDLNLYDPRKQTSLVFNILTNIPFHDEERKDVPLPPPPPYSGRGSCRHQWSTKSNQSSLPEGGGSPDLSSLWTVAAYCAECRSHLELSIDFREGAVFHSPCPTDDRPLHHFVHQPRQSEPWQLGTSSSKSETGYSWTDTQYFSCSSSICPARLVIRFKPPRLTVDWVDQLTDLYVIKARAERAMANDPERFEGHAVPLPATVVDYLRSYITDSLYEPKGKNIQGHNKKWLLALGDPCTDLLEYLGFVREGEDWAPPKPEPNAKVPFTNSLNIRLDDVLKELKVLFSKRPVDERRASKFQYIPEPATNELKSILGCADYKKSLRSRTVDLTKEEHPYYAGLGAVEDFHDDLIDFAYQRQIEFDPNHSPYYLECLQGIAEGRGSEQLRVGVAIEASADKISFRDVRAAFKELGLDSQAFYEDDTIIGTFNARVADGPKQEPEMRRALKIIGQIRSSEKIQYVASQAVTNHEQALLFLGAEEATSDEFIVSMHTLKVTDRPSDESTARHAVSLIADHRKSKALKKFLDTGALGEVEMDVGQAYVRLGISDRTIDDETILATYNLLVIDTPSQLDDLKSALTAIAKSKNSQRLKDFLNTGMVSSEHPPSEWPVGLENIGNTCYLNSLLQFYFTIKPLRDLVLDFDKFKMPNDEEKLKSKRVGSRNVSKKEVDRAQQFIDELSKLFQNMITSGKASVTPEPELARLTLVSSSKEEHIRRQSMLNSTRPSLGEINGVPVLGPMGPPPPQAAQDIDMPDSLADKASETKADDDSGGDNSSDVTLVDDAVAEDDDVMVLDDEEKCVQEKMLEDKENLPPSKAPSGRETDINLQPLKESSPSRINEQQHPSSPVKDAQRESIDLTVETPGSARIVDDDISNVGPDTKSISAAAAPPKRPPPFPPRPKPTGSNAVQEAEYGAQQDVTEVIANVLFQLQCAIKAESVDESGEQVDQVKALFFGKQKSYTTNREGTVRTKEEYMSDIKVDVATGSRDIYAALDGAYDVQDVEVGGGLEPQYTSISQLPPVLQVLVQRVQFDPEKKSVFKSNNHLELKETIYMDRYMDSLDADLMQRRQECWQWKKQVLGLEKRRAQLVASDMGMNVSDTLESTHHYFDLIARLDDEIPIGASPVLLQEIESTVIDARQELESLELQIKDLNTSISSQFSDLRKIPYRLQSVFIHRGYHNSGHYWIYIYDFTTQMWRKYNDGYVTEIRDTKEIFEKEPGDRPATPYFLVYVKDEWKEKLVEPVCRDVVDPPEGPEDVVMQDYNEGSAIQTLENSYSPADEPVCEAPSVFKRESWYIGQGWDDEKPAAADWNNKIAPGNAW